jgi:hypothetical protein
LLQFSSANESANDSLLKSRFSNHTSRWLVHSAAIFTWAETPESSTNLYIHSSEVIISMITRRERSRSNLYIKILYKGTYIILPSKLTFHRRRGSITDKVNWSKAKLFTLFPNVLSMEFGYIGVDRCPIPGICRNHTNDRYDGSNSTIYRVVELNFLSNFNLDFGICKFSRAKL